MVLIHETVSPFILDSKSYTLINTKHKVPFSPPENCIIYEIVPKNVVETGESQITSRHGAYDFQDG
jgi:hypothetical protein